MGCANYNPATSSVTFYSRPGDFERYVARFSETQMSNPTRTPEGPTNHCQICGALVTLAPSVPPGDVTCQNCGSLVWCANFRGSSRDSKKVHSSILASKSVLEEVARTTSSLPHLARALVQETMKCLNAKGGVFWVQEDDEWTPQYRYLQTDVSLTSPGFESFRDSALTATSNCKMTQCFGPGTQSNTNPTGYLLFYDPIPWASQQSFAILEIIQRPASEAAERGYQRFIGEMTALAGGHFQRNH